MLRSKNKDPGTNTPGLFMSKEKMGEYLKDLRGNRPSRPTGARPPPSSFVSKRNSTSSLFSPPIEAVPQVSPADPPLETQAVPPRCSSAQSFNRRPSAISMADPNAGRPLVRPPSQVFREDTNLEGIDENDPLSLPYLERGQRWMERQEAHSLRQALEDMDLSKEQKLHEAAQLEASELVWKHQNPKAAYRSPDAPYDYREHLRKESLHARTASWTRAAQDIQSRNTKLRSRDSSRSRSISGGSKSTSTPSSRVPSDSSLKVPDSPTSPVDETSSAEGERQSRKRSVQFVEPEAAAGALKNDKRARTPSPTKAPKSEITVEKKKADAPPEIKISNVAVAARVVSNTIPTHFRNPFARVRQTKGSLSRASTAPMPERKGLNTVEIQKNPPSQSRNAAYTANPPVSHEKIRQSLDEEIKMKDGKEIRSEEIRKATTMSLKDRSPKLPTPTMVSDSPGRPIVSFKQNWKPKEIELKQELSAQAPAANVKPYSKSDTSKPTPSVGRKERPQSSMVVPDRGRERTSPPPPPASSIPSIQIGDGPGIPSISVNSVPAIPSISVNTPLIAVSPPSIAVTPPKISVNAPPTVSVNGPSASRRPLPIPSKAASRPSPHHAATAPVPSLRNKTHFTPTTMRSSSALCANCALPISGRIVSAAGARFHPECFRCHHCAEGLECVAFYPEPDNFRSERVSRIRARIAGQYVEERVGQTDLEDGDETLRFYCHLDFHEFFSPRCKSCKTPIEGEVVVACGAEWHVGHFFCAQCGDPFDSSTPFVEKDGYAWCINCHTHRYSTKCHKCKKPVTDTVVKALGAEWHEDCFCCTGCKGRFTDGRYFIRPGGTEPYCPGCEERRLKA